MISLHPRLQVRNIGRNVATAAVISGLLITSGLPASHSFAATTQHSVIAPKKHYVTAITWTSRKAHVFERGEVFLRSRDGATTFGLRRNGSLALLYRGQIRWSSTQEKAHLPAKYLTLTTDGRMVLTRSVNGKRIVVWSSNKPLRKSCNKGRYAYTLRISGSHRTSGSGATTQHRTVTSAAITRIAPKPVIGWIVNQVNAGAATKPVSR